MKVNELFEEENRKDLMGYYDTATTGIDGSKTFDCYGLGLTSLKGAPETWNDRFDCAENELTNLKYAPHTVKGSFKCHTNKLTSLEGAPSSCKNFSCQNNKLTSLHNIHKIFTSIDNNLHCKRNPITSHVLGVLKIKNLNNFTMDNKEVETIINKYLPEGNIIECQQELIEAGFEDYAQL